nr:immunoglobulin heavy chain junction region [Macaca mulatta]
CTKKEDSFDVW